MTSQATPPVRVLHAFPTFAVGGSQVRFAKLATQLGSRFEHHVLALDGCYDCMALIDAAAPVRRAGEAPQGGPLATVPGFRRLFSTLRPDLVITYNWGAVECALAAALPPRYRHLHIEDGFGPDEVDGQMRRRVLFRRLALRRSQKVIVPSETLYDIAKQQWRIPEHKLALIPNGIDCGVFDAAPDPALAPSLRRAPDTLVIGTVATLRPEKNIGRLIDIFMQTRHEFDDMQLLIVGDGPCRTELEDMANDRCPESSVHFPGRIDTPQSVLGLIDVFVLSSNTEQMPISILEAMAAGLPVAGLAVGDVANMVSEPNRRFIARAGDEAGLQQAVRTLAKDADLRRTVGEANRKHVRATYSEASMVQAHAELMLSGS